MYHFIKQTKHAWEVYMALNENMDGVAINANKIELQGLKSKFWNFKV